MDFHFIFGPKTVAQALAWVLAAQVAGSPLYGQTVPTELRIVNVRGEGSVGRVRQRAAEDPAVRVLDEREKPVTGAAVVFTLPTEGATGTFANGSKSITVLTDSHGDAAAQGLRFNQMPGKVPIHVNASFKGLMARSSITEVSQAPAGYKPGGGGGHTGTIIAVIAVLAAAGAGGGYYAIHKSGTTPTAPVGPVAPSPIGITAGTGTLAPPPR